MKVIEISKSPEESIVIGKKLASMAKAGDTFALIGDLGTGKTLLSKGIALGLNIHEDITSPTFALMEIYEGRIPMYHFDLYRIEFDEEFDNLYFEEYWEGDGLSVIEWADKALHRLPDNTTYITLEYINETNRRITIEHPDN
jgi:tRNA threonylcarbamoyladenosine biosynthesis protein TsaE